jgi:hypothetical protein
MPLPPFLTCINASIASTPTFDITYHVQLGSVLKINEHTIENEKNVIFHAKYEWSDKSIAGLYVVTL